MPPKTADAHLNDQNKKLLEDWIKIGAPKVPTKAHFLLQDRFKNDTNSVLEKEVSWEVVNKKVEVSYSKNDQITAGYKMTVEDLQLDASLDNQFEILRQNIIGE